MALQRPLMLKTLGAGPRPGEPAREGGFVGIRERDDSSSTAVLARTVESSFAALLASSKMLRRIFSSRVSLLAASVA